MNPQCNFLKTEKEFCSNAFIIISEMVEMKRQAEDDISLKESLVNEVLHSIFFLGNINCPPISPEMVFKGKPNMYDDLKMDYPRPFELYVSQLPRRSPFSCVLDMIVHQTGPDNDEIKKRLRDFNKKLRGTKKKKLSSSAVCVSSTNTPDPVRYYGVSMSTFSDLSREIMIAASCYSSLNNYWDGYVADAVMTYCPDECKKDYFDGTIELPGNVRCETYSIRSGDEMPPCKSCVDLFGLPTTDIRRWAYGNCAEVESLSKLLKNEEQVKQEVKQLSDTVTKENRQEARKHIKAQLVKLLQKAKFEWEVCFYVPESAQAND